MSLRNVKYVQRLKATTPCTDCKIQYPYWVMQFDHVLRHTKIANISEMAKTATTKELLDEINKCEIVCANCHAERTHIDTMDNIFMSNLVDSFFGLGPINLLDLLAGFSAPLPNVD